jgi:hypothetical protein
MRVGAAQAAPTFAREACAMRMLTLLEHLAAPRPASELKVVEIAGAMDSDKLVDQVANRTR